MKYLFILNILAVSVYAQAHHDVEFSFESDSSKQVYLAGSLNNWSGENNPLVKSGEPPVPARLKRDILLPRHKLPKPIIEDNPEWVDIYYSAWEMLWNKSAAGNSKNGLVKDYRNEDFTELIYQWDTNFMEAFIMYAPDIFPAMKSLDNFYNKQRKDGYIQRVYKESDGAMVMEPSRDEPMVNPPLFAWIELKYFDITGDDSRLRKVLPKLVDYFIWINKNMTDSTGQGLYYNTSSGSGMDNIPRKGVGKSGWVDFSCQQALAAMSIANIATALEDEKTAQDFYIMHYYLSRRINKNCWDYDSNFYHDMTEAGGTSSTKHIGGYWALLSEITDSNRAARMVGHLKNPREFWRPSLIPALSADDPAYDSSGHYWCGGVWAPTNYMVIKGLEKYGYYDLAHEIAENHLNNIADVFYNFIPDENNIAFEERYADGYRTIWECYSPEFNVPATRWDNTFYSRQDFVGWSGLGPIAMLIENIIGLEVRGSRNKIIWRIRRGDKHGIKNLNLRGDKIDLICNPKPDQYQFNIRCSSPFDLIIKFDGKEIAKKIIYGNTAFSVPR